MMAGILLLGLTCMPAKSQTACLRVTHSVWVCGCEGGWGSQHDFAGNKAYGTQHQAAATRLHMYAAKWLCYTGSPLPGLQVRSGCSLAASINSKSSMHVHPGPTLLHLVVNPLTFLNSSLNWSPARTSNRARSN